MKITEKDKLELVKSIFTGKYSRETAHDEMDKIFKKYELENLINVESFTIKTQQIQGLISIINLLEKKQ